MTNLLEVLTEVGVIRNYDEKGNLIHYKDSRGFEYLYDYDENGHLIHTKDSDDYEEWRKYDEKGNQIYYKNSNGKEYWLEYDEKGHLIHFKNSNGFEEWHEYDENGNEIHFKNSDGDEEWYGEYSIYNKDHKQNVKVEDVHVFESLSHTLADKTNSIIETYTKEGWKVSQMNFYKGTELYGIQGHIPTIGYSIVFERKDD